MKARAWFLLVVLVPVLAACGSPIGLATDPASATPATSPAMESLLQRLCVDEGGERGVRCSTFYFADAAIPGWQEFINSIVQSYYGFPAQDYIKLLRSIGDNFVPQTYGDRLTPVYTQQGAGLAENGLNFCYPVAETESTITVPAGCDAVAVLIPRAEARSVDGVSAFPRSEYMNEIFGQPDSITTGIPQDAMRAALDSVLP